jgi:hypothetical protein
MELENPLVAIRQWLKCASEQCQSDIARLVGLTLLDLDLDHGLPETKVLMEEMMAWLDEKETPSFRVEGKALSFKICFEWALRTRFSEEGWENAKSLNRAMLDDVVKGEAPAGTAQMVWDALPKMEDQRKQWIELGDAWADFADQHLSLAALELWHIHESQRNWERITTPQVIQGTVVNNKNHKDR